MTDKVDELRKQLKDARQREAEPPGDTDRPTFSDAPRTDSPSHVVEQYAAVERGPDQRGSEPAVRRLHGDKGAVRATGNTQRKSGNRAGSGAPDSIGAGPQSGRLSQDNGSHWTDGTDISAGAPSGKRRVGNLETTDPIPPRTFDENGENIRAEATVNFENKGTRTKRPAEPVASSNPRGRPRKQESSPFIPPVAGPVKPERKPFLQGNTLSKSEAESLQEPLVNALLREFELLDKALWKFAEGIPQGQLEQPIWSNITDAEMESLTNIMLKLGQKSPAMAMATRAAVDGSDYVNAALLVGPRFMSTANLFKAVRQQARLDKANSYAHTPSRRERVQALRGGTDPNR